MPSNNQRRTGGLIGAHSVLLTCAVPPVVQIVVISSIPGIGAHSVLVGCAPPQSLAASSSLFLFVPPDALAPRFLTVLLRFRMGGSVRGRFSGPVSRKFGENPILPPPRAMWKQLPVVRFFYQRSRFRSCCLGKGCGQGRLTGSTTPSYQSGWSHPGSPRENFLAAVRRGSDNGHSPIPTNARARASISALLSNRDMPSTGNNLRRSGPNARLSISISKAVVSAGFGKDSNLVGCNLWFSSTCAV